MKRILGLLVLVLLVAPLVAQEAPAAPPAAEKPEPRSSATNHQITIDGAVVAYTATAGYLIVNDANEKPVAKFGYTAYIRDGFEDKSGRPITFAFNGGPGSASIWLHMGVLGPRIVVTPDAGYAPPPPYEVRDNEHSILDVSDLVMIDPVGTGFSRPLDETKGKEFWGVDQDIDSVSRFIKAYVTQNNRWASPKILLGESYGGMRSGGVSLALLEDHGMALNGVVLVSPFMEMVTGFDGLGVDLPHVMFLPTFAATAWYHDALETRPDDLEALMAEVRAFAYDELAPALLKGSRLGEAERSAVLTKLARYTGVDEEYWDRADLRVNHRQFVKELLRDRGQTAGRIDSRYAGRSFNLLGETMSYDPQAAAITAAFTSAFLDYYHNDLEFGRDLEYKVSGGLWMHWDWKHRQPDSSWFATPFPNTSVDLAYAMGKSPGMKLLIQQGYYDLATPHLATEYYIEHMDLTPEQRENVTFEYYEAGHMMYLHPPSLVKYKEDLARFILEATGR